MNDDLERNLRDSLDQHASATAHSDGNLNDVYHRVDLKHRRQRSLAVIGSIAALAGGVIGFAAFAAGGADPSVDLAAADASNMPTTTIASQVFACSGYLGTQDVDGSGPRELYTNCIPVTLNGPNVTVTTIMTPNCVVPTTIPMTTIPMTTMTTVVSSLADATAQAMPCIDPTGLPSECFPVMTTTTTSTTTTSQPAVIGTGPSDIAGQAVACGTYDPGITTVPFNTGTIATTSTTTTSAPPG